MMTEDRILEPVTCPHCGIVVSRATPATPESKILAPGTLACCAYCGNFCAFDDQMQARKLTPGEQFNIEFTETYADPEMLARLRAQYPATAD